MNSQSNRQPAFYIPHGGGPCFFMDWTLGPADTWDKMKGWLQNLSSSITTKPSAIIVISAHWETEKQIYVSGNSQPDLIYDYYGFPDHTYNLSYPAPGSPQLASEIANQLNRDNIKCDIDGSRGFDHGTFIPFKLIYPEADIPIVQLSLRADLDPEFHINVGRSLSSFRDNNILIVGSGMSYHNLKEMMKGEDATDALDESEAFNSWLNESSLLNSAERNQQLINWASAPSAIAAHPREEHLLPLMVIAGTSTDKAENIFTDKVMGARVSAYRFY